jgi:membrane protein YdbS with pleckstrin-like domain
MDQLHGMSAITSVGEKFLERRGQMVGINDKRSHSRCDQVIEHEGDQRLLENRDERFGEILGERPQPHPETGAEHESLRDHETAGVLVLCGHFARTGGMAEETIWRGTASQLKNLGCFILCFLFCWLIVPIFIGFRRYLETKNQVFELTNERLKMTQGIFSKVTETLELYRVKDIEVLQPFIYRTVGLENIKVNTSDLSSPVILIDGISQKVGFADKLRNQVEIIRAQKNVRELDIE